MKIVPNPVADDGLQLLDSSLSRPNTRTTQKTVVFDRSEMPKTVSDGANPFGEAWITQLIAQNKAKNTQFEFPGFGITNGTDVRFDQKNEEKWPFNFSYSAALEMTVYPALLDDTPITTYPTVASFAANVITDTVSQGWRVNQFKPAVTLTGTMTVSAAGSTVLTASNATPIQVTTTGVHNLVSNQAVTISGVVGNTAANGTWLVTVIDTLNFTLQNATTGANIAGNGAYVSGGAVAAGIPNQSQAIKLSGATTVALVKDGILPVGVRYARLSADVPIGSTSLPIYPLGGGINNSDTMTFICYGPAYFAHSLSGSSVGRYALINANAAGTVTVNGGMTTMASTDQWEIVCVRPIQFGANGASTQAYSRGNVVTQPIPERIYRQNIYKLRTWVSGTKWPAGQGFRSAFDQGGNTDTTYSGAGSGLSTGPLLPCANYGDPIGVPLKTVGGFGDSKIKGTGDFYITPAAGWLARACYRTVGFRNLGTPGEAGGAAGVNAHKAEFRRFMMESCDTVFIGFGTNDLLDGTPSSFATMQTMMLNWAQMAVDAGVTKIVAVTIGPLTTGAASAYFPGNEGSQTVVQSATLALFDNWLATIPAPFTHCFDVRTLAQLTGTPGKWQTFASVLTGTPSTTGAAKTLVDTVGLNGANPQLQYQGYGIKLLHNSGPGVGVTEYNQIDPGVSTNTAGTLTVTTNWANVPLAGDTYNIHPLGPSSADGTHYGAYLAALMAASVVSQGLL